jgi:hypothetical protein
MQTVAELEALGPIGFLPVITEADRKRSWDVDVIEGHMGFHDNHVRAYLSQDDASVRDMLYQSALYAALEREGAFNEPQPFYEENDYRPCGCPDNGRQHSDMCGEYHYA